jgi:membrane-bound metal-dependent hydrolase YbcI (DUF457 family)
MPTVGHLAVGLAAGRLQARERPRLRSLLVLTGLATFPDLDILLPVAPSSVWAHRGALHSLLLAVVAALIGFWLLDRRAGRARALVVAVLTASSHGLLDALTRSGAGVMLLWPFREARYLSPLQVLPASAFGVPFPSRLAFGLLIQEALLFAPLVLYALWPRRAADRAARASDA